MANQVNDVGPLDWRVSITDKDGRPSPEFQRRWNTNRNNTSLITPSNFGTGSPTDTPSVDGASYYDTTSAPYRLYVGYEGTYYPVTPVGANPTATASDVAVAGTASTFMRSDAAPAVQKASATQFGIVKVDGSTIDASSGVISVPTATTSALGLVKPDGSTIDVSSGLISVPTATTSSLGLVRPDGTTITITGGIISSTGGGGGGGSWDFSPPHAADFPTFFGTVYPTLTDDTNIGLILDSGAPASGDVQRLACKTLPSGDFTVVAKLIITHALAEYNCGGICLVDSLSNNCVIWGRESNANNNYSLAYRLTRLTIPSGFGSNPIDAGTGGTNIIWYRVRRTGALLNWDYSEDGKSWINMYQANESTFFAGNSANYIGLGFTLNQGSGSDTYMSVPYWHQSF